MGAIEKLAGEDTAKNLVTVTAKTIHGEADEQKINIWELEAATRILNNLKTLLYGDPMRKLINEQVEESDRLLKKYLAESNGKFTDTQVILTVNGLSAEQYFNKQVSALAQEKITDETIKEMALTTALPMLPEYYSLPKSYLGVIETMGGLPTRSRVQVLNENIPEFISDKMDMSYPHRMAGRAFLDDGTLFTYVLQQFKDVEDGMEANLRIWYPAACPPIYLEEHAMHYAVEFRHGFRSLAEKIKQKKN